MVSGFFIHSEITSVRKSALEDLSGLARVISINLQAPLEFTDQETAEEVLVSLSARPHIMQARVYTRDNQLFAKYSSSGASAIRQAKLKKRNGKQVAGREKPGYWVGKKNIEITVPVGSGGTMLGSLSLQSDTHAFEAILSRLVYVVAGILIATLLLALMLIRVIDRYISRHVLTLASTMENICREENYSIRAEKTSADELGVLVDGINTMLDGLERRDEQLVEATREAENANRAKSLFLAQMSHEIRTPLNGVLGIAALLLKTPLDDKQRDFVQTMYHSGEALLNLINDILDFSKIEAGNLELEKVHFNLRELTEQTIDLFSNRALEKNVRLSCFVQASLPEYIVGDPGRLRQILMNLLSNALKFTRDGDVSLSIFPGEQRKGNKVSLRFEVSDSGIGISSTKQKEIFSAFSQADGSTTRQFGGTGLGLAICRQLVDLMGGKIGVESTEGNGATFWFVVSFVPGKAEEAVTFSQMLPPEEQSVNFSGRVLVAEDNVTNQIVARGMLEQAGLQVEIVDNGRKAVNAFNNQKYDLVFMDCQMPVMDGYEATGRIRQFEKQTGVARTPILALTAHAMKGDREHCLSVGMDDYLTKPFTEQQLHAVLHKWLVSSEAVKERPEERAANQPGQEVVFDETVLESYRLYQQKGEPDIVRRLVVIFLKHTPGLLREMAEADADKNLERLWPLAHSLKSSSANIGAIRLAGLCEEMERMGRQKKMPEIFSLTEKIAREYSRVSKELQRVMMKSADSE
jgi:signal transduction histidine kinase/CheY-like chemotaxis protein/HPt (histidine-containing phosphotransfer) domain-containing protein